MVGILDAISVPKGIALVHPGDTAFKMWVEFRYGVTTKSCSSFPVGMCTNWVRIPGGFFCHDGTDFAVGTSAVDSRIKVDSMNFGNSDLRIALKSCASPLISEIIPLTA